MISKNQACFIWYFFIILFIPLNLYAGLFPNSIPAVIDNTSEKDWTVEFDLYPGSVSGGLCKNHVPCIIKAKSKQPILYETGFSEWIKGWITLTDSSAYAKQRNFKIQYWDRFIPFWYVFYPGSLYVENAAEAGTTVDFSDHGDITIKWQDWGGIPY